MIKLPGNPKPLPPITKTDVIARHINASMQLMSLEANPYSTHVVVMAGEALVRSLAKVKEIDMPFDFRKRIKPEYLPEFIKLKNNAYNYFKHADKDFDKTYDGPSYQQLLQINDIETMMTISALPLLGEKLTQPMKQFIVLCGLLYPDMFKWEELFLEHPALRLEFEKLPGKIDRSLFVQVLRRTLQKDRLFPEIEEI